MLSSLKKVLTSTKELTPGVQLGGKYRIDDQIAEGGMSFVFLARDQSLDERVAIKVLKPAFRGEKDVLARFVREAKTIRRIQSDHCVKVLEVGMDPDHGPFLVMEYLEGSDLRTVLDQIGRFTPRRACEIAIQVCEALSAAHTNDCVHRDIKPDNIIVVGRGELEDVRVLDFGISKHALTGSVLDQDLSLVNTISLMGTPMYMAPEQMRSTAGADWRTDIWSLGAMLYEMLSGRPPFMSESITELCSMVLQDEPIPLTALEPTIPEELGVIVERCLRKNPAERFQNVGELALALFPFAPRRARMPVEKVLTTLAVVGVDVDRSAISEGPSSSSDVSAPPIAIPKFASVPRDLGVDAVTQTSLPATSSKISLVSDTHRSSRGHRFVPTVPSRRKRMAALVVLAASMLTFLAVVVAIKFWSHQTAGAAHASAPPPHVDDLARATSHAAGTIVSAPAVPQPHIEASSSIPGAEGDGTSPSPRGATHRVVEAKKPASDVSAPRAKLAAPTPKERTGSEAPLSTSKVRVLDDEPARPKVVD